MHIDMVCDESGLLMKPLLAVALPHFTRIMLLLLMSFPSILLSQTLAADSALYTRLAAFLVFLVRPRYWRWRLMIPRVTLYLARRWRSRLRGR